MYRCPICFSPLTKDNNTYRCQHRHSYDIARRGYVNLLPPKAAVPGDNKEMVVARRLFLDAGYYAPFSDGVNRILTELHAGTILDAGCGEGYYTSRMPGSLVCGADISKEAVDRACRRSHASLDHAYCVASVFHLPYMDGHFDAAVSLFAPIAAEELRRVLKPDGYLLVGAPDKDHLIELKQALYDEAYENDGIPPEVEGFTKVKTEVVRYKMDISSNEHLTALFSMTPYAYHTSREGMARLAAVDALSVTAAFTLTLYKRNEALWQK